MKKISLTLADAFCPVENVLIDAQVAGYMGRYEFLRCGAADVRGGSSSPKRSIRGIAVLAAAAIVGAITGSARADGPISLWYDRGTPEQQQILQKDLVEPFNAAHPESPLTLEFRSGKDSVQQIRMALMSGKGPDIVMTPGPSYTTALIEAGQIIPLDGYIKKYGWDKRILGAVLNSGFYDGKNYALPRSIETMVLYYNKTLFSQNGWQPPKTIDELNTLSTEMLKKGITPFAAGNSDWRGANEWHVTIALNHIGGPDAVYKALKGEIPWTAPVFEQSIDLLKDWYQKGWYGKNYFSLTGDQNALQLAKAQAGMAPTGTWAYQYMVDAFKQTGQELGIAPFPSLQPNVPYPTYTIGVGSTMSINAHSKNPDGAAAFLDYMYSDEFFDKISKDWPGDWTLPLTSMNEQKLAANVTPLYASTISSFINAVGKGNYGYTTWVYWPPATEDYLIRGIEQVWLDQISSKDYLAKMQETFAGELKGGKVPPIAPR